MLTSLSRLRTLVFTQRAARLLLRAAWTWLAGYLMGWGVYTLWSWLPLTVYWFALGAALAAPALIAIFRPLRTRRLAWQVDRHLEAREQVTTALHLAEGDRDHNRVEDLLIEDAASLLRGFLPRTLRLGWWLQRDAEALGVVLGLLAAIILVGNITGNIRSLALGGAGIGLPGLASAPSYDDVFPSGIPGLSDPLVGDPEGNAASGSGGMTPEEIAAIDNILSDLGEALSEHPETAEAGEALQDGDLEGAAAAIERTADNVDLLPEEARQNMQEALQQAAQQARAAGQEELAEDLERAAAALESTDPNDPLTADALDELADGLRELGETFGAMAQAGEPETLGPPDNAPQVGSAEGGSGSGAGQGAQGSPEPITRLDGQGEDFTIEGSGTPGGLLAPSSGGDPTGTGGTSATVGSGSPGDTGTIDSILTPYSFPWRWLSIVSDYFSPQ